SSRAAGWPSRPEARASSSPSRASSRCCWTPRGVATVLRRLERLHRQIQEGSFRTSLPAERNQLFRLLQQMESSGGWPYIPRPQLHTFIKLIQAAPESASGPQLAGNEAP
ncbi:MAG: hypothetical protein R6W06_05400, partial [Prochlorococcaceae cyanobacterium]